MQGGPVADRQAEFYWTESSYQTPERVGDRSPRTRTVENDFPSSSSIDLYGICVSVEQGQQWVTDKKEGQCQ